MAIAGGRGRREVWFSPRASPQEAGQLKPPWTTSQGALPGLSLTQEHMAAVLTTVKR